jgi:CRISPR/Cas system-associated exonuclease Cas4 (RecB family)
MDLDIQQLEATIGPVEQRRAIIPTDNHSLALAVSAVQDLRQVKAMVEETFNPHVARAHESHKSLIATRDRFIAPIDAVELDQRNAIATYVIANPDAKAPGLSVRSDIAVEITEEALGQVVALVVKGKLPWKLLGIDKKVAKDLIKSGIKIPGVTVTPTDIVTIRG